MTPLLCTPLPGLDGEVIEAPDGTLFVRVPSPETAPDRRRLAALVEPLVVAALEAGEGTTAIGKRYGITKWSVHRIREKRCGLRNPALR